MFTANLRDIHTLGKGSCDCLVITTYAEKVKLAPLYMSYTRIL